MLSPQAQNPCDCGAHADLACADSPTSVWYNMVSPTLSDGNAGRSPAPLTQQINGQTAGYGLRREILSPMETLAQSVSTIAPTATPAATIPLVCALAGNGTWLAYLLATAAILLVAWCIGRFARYSSSPGSLYSYAAMILPPWVSSIAAWSLLLAYVATASSVIGGLYQYAIIFVGKSGIHPVPAVFDLLASDRRFDLDCVAGRENFSAPDAVDRSQFRIHDYHAGRAGARAPWFPCRFGPAPPARHDRQRPSLGTGSRSFQLCRF